MKSTSVGILVFPDVEVLDFAGPFEVFSVTRLNEETRYSDSSPFDVFLLDGLRATSHWRSLDRMAQTFPSIRVEREQHVVDEGRVLTSAGISATRRRTGCAIPNAGRRASIP